MPVEHHSIPQRLLAVLVHGKPIADVTEVAASELLKPETEALNQIPNPGFINEKNPNVGKPSISIASG